MKRIFIIHGWGATPNSEWLPWAKKQLQEKGFDVIIPEMPNTEEPMIEEWVPFIENLVGEIDENTFLIGHSVGSQAVIRYIEKLSEEKKLGGIILVAPWGFNPNEIYDDEDEKLSKPWLETQINWEKVKPHSKFVCIFSDNDPYIKLTDSEFLKPKLNAKIVIESGKFHFSDEHNIKEIPILLEEILKLSKN